MTQNLFVLTLIYLVNQLSKYLTALAHVCIGIFITAQLTSCVATKPPQFEYFQRTSGVDSLPTLIQTALPQVSKIQKGDILGIIVSTLNKESNEILNFPTISSLPVSVFSAGAGGGGNQPIGFPVDSAGYIAMPIIGKQKLEGLTIESAEIKLRTELEKTLKEPSVNVRFMNHKFSVLGEVGNIGTFNLLDDQTTILDALIAAGDLSVYAKRDSVMVIRNKNGMREIGRVNFRTREVFTSPYFYLQNGDVIYVEPTKDKIIPPQPLNQNLQRVTTYISIVTTVLSLVFLLSRL